MDTMVVVIMVPVVVIVIMVAVVEWIMVVIMDTMVVVIMMAVVEWIMVVIMVAVVEWIMVVIMVTVVVVVATKTKAVKVMEVGINMLLRNTPTIKTTHHFTLPLLCMAPCLVLFFGGLLLPWLFIINVSVKEERQSTNPLLLGSQNKILFEILT